MGEEGRSQEKMNPQQRQHNDTHTHTDREKSMSMNGTKAELIKN